MKNIIKTKWQLITVLAVAIFNFNSLVIIASATTKNEILTIVGLYVPVVFISYQLIYSGEQLPGYVVNIFLAAVTLMGLDVIINNVLLVYIYLFGESQVYSIYDHIYLLLIITYIIIVILTNLKSVAELAVRIMSASFIIFTLIIIGTYFTTIFSNEHFQIVSIESYSVNLLSIFIPCMYLLVIKMDHVVYKSTIRASLSIITVVSIVMIVLTNNSQIIQMDYIFTQSAFIKTLSLNFSNFMCGIIIIISILLNICFFIVIYNQTWKYNLKLKQKKAKDNLFISFVPLAIIATLVTIFAKDTFSLLIVLDETYILIHLILTVVISLLAIYLCFKIYLKPKVKAILLIAGTFPLMYCIYYLNYIDIHLSSYISSIINSLNHLFFIVSALIFIYYTLESLIFLSAHRFKLNTSDLNVAEQYEYIYVMIPCMNEDLVINNTLQSVLNNDYPNLEVYVIDDASSDETKSEVLKISDSRCNLFERFKPNAQIGKGEALNWAYKKLINIIDSNNIDHNRVLIAIIDADTEVSCDYFYKVNKVFQSDQTITGLQSKVRVVDLGNDRAQDLEFSEIINASQSLRNKTGTVAFGGNGQFCKLSTLEVLKEEPWSKSLVEDFDLSTRLYLSTDNQINNVQYDDIYIMQSGITNDIPALVKQRVRWAQGNIQSSKYIPQIIRARNLYLKQKIELLSTLIKPWLMAIEYTIFMYTLVLLADVLIIEGISKMLVMVIASFLIMAIYIVVINLVWAILYNRQKSRQFSVLSTIIDCFYLTKFLFTLTQIYPQSIIRHIKSENGWDKTNRQVKEEKL